MIKKILLFLMSFQISLFSCADYWDPNSVYYLFLDKRDSIFLSYSEDLKNPSIYNTIVYNYSLKSKELNLKEWEEELKQEYSIEEIEQFLYKRKNLDLLKNKEVLEYINFVDEQEKCVYQDYYYYFKKDKEEISCGTFVQEAIKNIEKVNSDYLKLRYFYLALRLAHFEKQEALKIYEEYKYLLKNNNETIVKDWIQGIYAGALVKSGENAKGVYEFSKLFDKAVNQHLAFYNFHHIKSEEDFNKLLDFAQDNEEKTKFFAIRALNSTSNRVIEMQNIYNLDKNSKWLDFLLYKNLLESQTYFNIDTFFEKEIEDDFYTNYISFLESIKDNENYLVELSLGYFYIYTKQFDKAKNISEELNKKYPNIHEVETLSFILYLNSLSTIDEDIENEIFTKLKPFLDENHYSTGIYRYTINFLVDLYKNNNMPFEEFLLKNTLYINFEQFDNLENFKKLEEFLKTNQESELRDYLQKTFKKRINKVDSYEQKSFEAVKVKILINNLKFQEALDTNAEILDEELEFNPFNSFIKGNNRTKSKKNMQLREFLNKILEIKKVLEEDENSVIDNYLYANAMYNLSYFGNNDRITTYYRSNYSFHTKDLQNEKLKLALRYYEKAFEHTQNNEFKAKITYQLAKTKLALFDLNYDEDPQSSYWFRNKQDKYLYGSNDKFYIDFLNDGGSKYFDRIKDDYKDTKFYLELLNECGDFSTYVNLGKGK